MEDVRPAAVAGRFYPSERAELDAVVAGFTTERTPEPALGVVVPHAGLVYSGACAGIAFSRVAIPDTCVILAPNHTGAGRYDVAAGWAAGRFRTPLGELSVASDFFAELRRETRLVDEDRAAHISEHAIEVILPFLQQANPETEIVPLVLPWDTWPECSELGRAVARVTQSCGRSVLLIASSDMNHCESAEVAREKDTLALEEVTRLDPERLLSVCRSNGITMCGRAPAATVLEACRQLGATSAEVVDYRHSGWVTGDDSSVVAYAGIVIK